MIFRVFSLYFSARISRIQDNEEMPTKMAKLDMVMPKNTNPYIKELAGKVEVKPDFELSMVPNAPFSEAYTSPYIDGIGIHE